MKTRQYIANHNHNLYVVMMEHHDSEHRVLEFTPIVGWGIHPYDDSKGEYDEYNEEVSVFAVTPQSDILTGHLAVIYDRITESWFCPSAHSRGDKHYRGQGKDSLSVFLKGESDRAAEALREFDIGT